MTSPREHLKRRKQKALAAIAAGNAPDDMDQSFVSTLAEHPGTKKILLCHGFGLAALLVKFETIREWISSIQ